MKKELKKIKEHSFENVINDSELCFFLIKIYSKIYKNGQSVRTCKNSLRVYYDFLTTNFEITMDKIEIFENSTRTCRVAFKGLRYISRAGEHYNSETITDEQAIWLLKRGFLTESDFIILPEKWKEKERTEILEILENESKKLQEKGKTAQKNAPKKTYNKRKK